MSEKKINFTPEQVESIRKNFLVNHKTGKFAPHEFVALFIHTAEHTGLDPFKRHIMATSRNVKVGDGVWKEVWSIVTTIDGFRAIAATSGEYEGQGGPYWCGSDGQWCDIWTKPTKDLYAAKVEVYRKGCRAPIVATARFDSYKQTNKSGELNDIWAKFGDHMTAKCAEALALRKAFPQELGGLYTTDEMAQAHKAEPEPEPEPQPKCDPWTEDQVAEAMIQLNTIADMFSEKGIPEPEIEAAIEKAKANLNTGECTLDTFLTRLYAMAQRVVEKYDAASR